jgi:hypothetical protein
MPNPSFLVVQEREYRQHQIELVDGGKAYAVVVRPPPSMGEEWEVACDEGGAMTMAEMFERAKARIDAAMGPRPPQRFQRGTQRCR